MGCGTVMFLLLVFTIITTLMGATPIKVLAIVAGLNLLIGVILVVKTYIHEKSTRGNF